MTGETPDLPPPIPVNDPLLGGTTKHLASRPDSLVTPNSTVARTNAPPDAVFAPAQTLAEKTELADEAHNLADEVSGLREAATALSRRTARNGYVVGLTAIGLILDIALSFIAFVLLHNQSVTDAQIRAQQEQITASVREQCSLYELLIPSYREATRQVSPLGPIGYDSAYKRIQGSADRLQCGIPHSVPGT